MPLTENRPTIQRQTNAQAPGKENNPSGNTAAAGTTASTGTAGIIRSLPRRSRSQRRGRGRSQRRGRGRTQRRGRGRN